jgi:hypothetical protein
LVVAKNRNNLSFIKEEPYIAVNLLLALIIAGVLVYSLVFSPDKGDYPVVCVHELLTGEPCVSCGLSHSFSLILRGRFEEAFDWNPHGIRLFLFFSGQLSMRILFSFLYFFLADKRRSLVITDIALSLFFALYSFWPFLVYIYRLFISLA